MLNGTRRPTVRSLCHVLPPTRSDARVPGRSIDIDADAGRPAADIGDDSAKLLFLGCQHRLGGRQRRRDHVPWRDIRLL